MTSLVLLLLLMQLLKLPGITAECNGTIKVERRKRKGECSTQSVLTDWALWSAVITGSTSLCSLVFLSATRNAHAVVDDDDDGDGADADHYVHEAAMSLDEMRLIELSLSTCLVCS